MIASLPMYVHPNLDALHQRYWGLIRQALAERDIDSPVALSQQSDDFTTWLDADLVLSQSCGMPFRNQLQGRVGLVGAPDYELDGCRPGFGYSLFVVRADDARHDVDQFDQAMFVFNERHSNSGLSAPYNHMLERGFWFPRQFESGSHFASAQALVAGRADIAAIDAVTWRLLERHESFVRDLKVIDATVPTPGLPYICGPRLDPSSVFAAVNVALAGLTHTERTELGLSRLVEISADDYLAIPNPPDEVIAA